jgi:hypothetical protein
MKIETKFDVGDHVYLVKKGAVVIPSGERCPHCGEDLGRTRYQHRWVVEDEMYRINNIKAESDKLPMYWLVNDDLEIHEGTGQEKDLFVDYGKACTEAEARNKEKDATKI